MSGGVGSPVATTAGTSSDDAKAMWSLLPSFDPGTDDAREYAQKVRFLHGVLPQKDRGQLAPRLAMLCKGTAWSQVRALDPEKLTHPTDGIKLLLQALSSWEESEEMATYEKFEKVMYRISQKSDESTTSFVNRLGVAFAELGDTVTVKDFHAFVLLRQSCLSVDDKKKILTMTNGKMETKLIDQAMRSLATRVLTSANEPKKKVYPVNYSEVDHGEPSEPGETAWHVSPEEEDEEGESIEYLAQQGDADALTIQTFEQDLEDLFQSTPDLQTALVSYQEARMKLSERKKFRGFWPTSRGFGGKGKSKGKGKSFSKSTFGGGKTSLLDRISKTHCKLCGEKGHWKAECPNRSKENANFVLSSVTTSGVTGSKWSIAANDVLYEESRPHEQSLEFAFCNFVDQNGDSKGKNKPWKEAAISFLSHRLKQRRPVTKNEEDQSASILQSSSSDSAIFHVTTDGSYAVLDTGASRSVIGSELVPSLLKDLPAGVRTRVREVASNVGFRFGNNHVLHSQSQIQVPLSSSGKKTWLVIEVVPGATPFLLSIRAMKCLGAQIDLGNNEVYLKGLARSLTIYENRNGLLTLRLRDLCMDTDNQTGKDVGQTIYHSQHIDSSDQKASHLVDQSRVFSHAESSRHDSDHQNDFRTGDGESQSSIVPVGDFGGGSFDTSTSSGGKVPATEWTVDRSSTTTASNRGDCTDLAQPEPSSINAYNSISGSGDADNSITGSRDRFGSGMGTGIECDISPDRTTSSVECNANDSSTTVAEDDKCKSWNDNSHGAVSVTFTTNDVSTSKSDAIDSSYGDSTQHGCIGSGDSQSRIVGSEVCQLGEEMEGNSIPRSVRERSAVCGLDFCPGIHPDQSDDGFLHVLPDPRTDGAGVIDETSQCLVDQDFCHLLLASFVSSPWEERLLRASLKDIKKKPSIDLLEVYASEDSRLTKAVEDLGGKSLRFTKQDGDLSTFDGRVKLIRMVFEYSPRHLWLAPECLPWCAWNQFNQSRSIHQWERVHDLQEESRPHLRLCNLLMKIQRDNNRHCHIENPAGSGLWKQPEIQESLQSTLPAKFDQCQMGLKHPQNHRLIRKRTIVQSTSKNIHEILDDHLCSGQHVHAPIAGSCKLDGRRMLVSRFAAFYPTGLAKRIAKGIMQKNHQHVDFPVYPVETLDEEILERPQKRSRKEEHIDDRPDQSPRPESRSPPKGGFLRRTVRKRHLKEKTVDEARVEPKSSDDPWLTVFQQLKQQLPRVGAKEFRTDSSIFQDVQTLNPKMNIRQVIGCKGVEKFLNGDNNNPHRHTVAMKRFSNEIVDLGCEAWTTLSQTQQRRKAIPSHIMLCMFGSLKEVASSSPAPAVPNAVPEQELIPNTESTAEGHRKIEEGVDIETLQPWTPAPVSQSGPKFNALSSGDKSIIRKLHHNLGHPSADTLSRHLAFQGSRQELIEGAKDFQCSACMERRPPKKGSPGELKPAREFNEVVGIDGFEWSNQYGVKVYVLHAFDEGTHFHLGRRTNRDGLITQKCLSEFWLSWAGSPNRLYFDAAGEFLAETWKNFLQKENITHKLTAESWQRGRVERHGGIIKEMLSRMNQQVPIRSEIEFDQCLLECFKAKNSLSNHEGFSPEQAVLGKASKLPASVISDETTSAHMLADSSHPEGEQFRMALSRRTAARESFLRCENSSALRRALLRQSKGEIINWHTGQLCMYWSKRNAPNMLEKGRWMGPAQVVLQESRSIVWISHVNRLLRCARENLRPVSLKEFQDLKIAQQSIDQDMLASRARELERQLRERSGVFQFRDLSGLEVNPDDSPPPNVADNSAAPQNGQPEEEPLRRESLGQFELPPVHEIPIPEGNDDELLDEPPLGTDSEYMPTTPSFQSDNGQAPEAAVENSGETIAEPNDVGVIYNATLIEPALDKGDCIVEDDSSFWSTKDTQKENFCAFEFSAPLQQIRKYRNHPEESIVLLANAAKKSHAEVSYRNLNPEERKLFDVAKKKELTCWLDTNTVKAILKSRVHPDRIMGSRWVLTWKTCDISSSGYKAKARLVVKGFQDPEVGQVQTDSPTLSRDARMLLLQTVALISKLHF